VWEPSSLHSGLPLLGKGLHYMDQALRKNETNKKTFG